MDVKTLRVGADPEYLRDLAVRLDKIVPKVANDMAAVDALREASKELNDMADAAEVSNQIGRVLNNLLTEDSDAPTPGCNCPPCLRKRGYHVDDDDNRIEPRLDA